MRHSASAATHLRGVTFEIYYHPSPFYPSGPVFAQFSGVLNLNGQLHAKLDTGSIPGPSVLPGVPIHGFFAIDDGDEMPMSFSGLLCNNLIHAEAQLPPG